MRIKSSEESISEESEEPEVIPRDIREVRATEDLYNA